MTPCRRLPLAAFTLLLVLAGCGGGKRASDVTVTRTVTTPSASSTATSGKTAATTSATATTTPTPTTTATAPPSNPHAPLKLVDAEHSLSARGFAVLTERDFRPDQVLKVLLGVRRGSADARTQQAFFFVGDRYVGTDTSDTSAGLEVLDQGSDHVTLAYMLYRRRDALCCASGGSAQVTYRWNGTRLVPQGPIPSSSADAALSRR